MLPLSSGHPSWAPRRRLPLFLPYQKRHQIHQNRYFGTSDSVAGHCCRPPSGNHVHTVKKPEPRQSVQERVVAWMGGHWGPAEGELLQLVAAHQTLDILRPDTQRKANRSADILRPDGERQVNRSSLSIPSDPMQRDK